MFNLNVVIVGGGVAGLSTSIALQRKGHAVTILERHPGCQALGGPVRIWPNATRVLIDYGMEEIMSKKNTAGRDIFYMRRFATGEVLESDSMDTTIKLYGYPSWILARYRLQETLAQVASERGVKIRFNSEVVGVDLEKTAVTLKDGSIIKADLIIGTDGMAC